MAKYTKAEDAFGNVIEVGDYVMYAHVDKTPQGRIQSVRESRFVTGRVIGFTPNYVTLVRVDLETLNGVGKRVHRLPKGVGKVEIVDEKA